MSTAVLYCAIAIPYTLFVILYAVVSRPRDAIGRSLLLSMFVVALLAWNAVLALWLGDYAGRMVVRVLVIGGALVAGWSQLALLVREQRAARRCPTSDTEET